MRAILLLLLTMTSASAEILYAHVNQGGTVDWVIVAEQTFINTGVVGNPSDWHLTYVSPTAIQPKNYAGLGYSYDPGLNCFVPPIPPSAQFNPTTCLYNPVAVQPNITGQ
jgi:hypothetical protein